MCLRSRGNAICAHAIKLAHQRASPENMLQKLTAFEFQARTGGLVSVTVPVVAIQTSDEIDQAPDLSLA
jgi:hypothetical protein